VLTISKSWSKVSELPLMVRNAKNTSCTGSEKVRVFAPGSEIAIISAAVGALSTRALT